MAIGSRIVQSERDSGYGHRAVASGLADRKDQQQQLQFAQAQRAQQAFNALPGATEYNADQAYLTGWLKAGGLPSTRAQNESYYKLLPALSRGHLVPDGYPMGYGGFLIQDNTIPRIASVVPGQEKANMVVVSATKVRGIAALPRMTAAAFIALQGTVVYQRNARNQPITWFNRTYMVMLSYQPHVLFNTLYVGMKIFLDPSSPYADQQFHAWQEPTYLQRLTLDAVVVVTAIFGGEALGSALDGTAAGSAAAGGGAAAGAGSTGVEAGGSLAPQATFTGELAQPVAAVDTGLTSSTLAPLAAGGAGGGLTLGGVVSAVGTASSVLKAVVGTAAAVLGIAGAVKGAPAPKPAAKPAASTAAPPLSRTAVVPLAIAGLAGIAGLFLLAGD